jgi:signal transduction histidine kinase
MPIQQELKIFIKSEKRFLFIFLAFLAVAVPAAYYSISYLPWKSQPLTVVLILAGLGLVFLIDRLLIPQKYIRKVEIFEILITVFAIFGVTLATGAIYSPLNIFYFVPIAFAFFIISRRLGFSTFALVILMLLIESVLMVWPDVSPRSFAPYIPFLLSYLIGLFYVVTIMMLVSGTLRRVERERTAAQERSKYLQKLLENLRALDKEKNKFLSNIAHHFRTPLSVFRWSMDSIMRNSENLTQKQKELIEDMKEADERLILLLRKIMTVSKWDLRQAECQKADVSLLLKETVERQTELAKEKRINIKADIPENITAEINREGIKEVLDAVFKNAVIYNKPGGEILIEARKKQGNVSIKIADTGIGIPEKEQKLLFTAFFRADNVKNIDAGVRQGLDLFIAKKIIEGHGGEINIKSEEGKGTTVYITLPQKQKAD